MADEETHMQQFPNKTEVRFKYTTFTESFNVNDSGKREDISLQEAFRIYKEAKQDEIRRERLIRKRRELRKADPQKMAALRQKFLNQAKKYFGYPYAKKYWPPDSPEYKSKLFLDCCGLVRKVMQDLADNFGFIMGPWNQAYMYDTLPITVPNEREMKPGDLVFVSAIYYNPKSKKQRHNMTHVEIWAGEGNKTIGARWNNGKVQVWDSYKFLAKSYHSETYHFKSIDTWLMGICRSHCPDHRWKRAKYSPKKKSIFAVPEQIQVDEAAGDDDDNVDNFAVRGNTFCEEVTGVSRMVAECKTELLKRPKTDMDKPSLSLSASGDSIESPNFSEEFPVITNDLGKLSCRSPRKGRKSVCGERRNSSNENIRETQLSLENRTLTDLGKKGLYLKDFVDGQKQSGATGTAFVIGDDDDDDDYDEEDDIGDDVEGSDDDLYKDDEISDDEYDEIYQPEKEKKAEDDSVVTDLAKSDIESKDHTGSGIDIPVARKDKGDDHVKNGADKISNGNNKQNGDKADSETGDVETMQGSKAKNGAQGKGYIECELNLNQNAKTNEGDANRHAKKQQIIQRTVRSTMEIPAVTIQQGAGSRTCSRASTGMGMTETSQSDSGTSICSGIEIRQKSGENDSQKTQGGVE